MENNKYTFGQYQSSIYKVDPVFKTEHFTVFGNPMARDYNPDLFEVYIKERRFRYCLIQPYEVIKNEELLLKIRRYLICQEYNPNLDNPINTYFIGNMEKSIDVSKEFKNQNVLLVTYEMIEQWYPKNVDKIFEILIKVILRNQKYLGETRLFHALDDDILFVDPKLNEGEKHNYKMYLQKSMEEEGLISIVHDGISYDRFTLTAKAINLIENTKQDNNKNAFIALKFENNEKRINIIQKAIAEAGFEPKVMSHFETNNWIMPEIFHQIEISRFVVVDFSLPCNGAYYEAGYAAALNKPVIHLFDKREERDDNKLHFDIAQKSTIFYNDFDDLHKRLLNRITTTIKNI